MEVPSSTENSVETEKKDSEHVDESRSDFEAFAADSSHNNQSSSPDDDLSFKKDQQANTDSFNSPQEGGRGKEGENRGFPFEKSHIKEEDRKAPFECRCSS